MWFLGRLDKVLEWSSSGLSRFLKRSLGAPPEALGV